MESSSVKKRRTNKIKYGLVDSSDSEQEIAPLRRKRGKKHRRIVKLIIRKAEDRNVRFIYYNYDTL